MPPGGKRLLVEVGIEEAPPWFIRDVLSVLPGILKESLEHERLGFSDVRVMATPRRIAALVSGLADRQPDESRQIPGPPARAAMGADGKFLPPAIKFAEKSGGSEKDLVIIETERGRYVAVNVTARGLPAKEVIADLLPAIFSERTLPHQKSMRWGEGVGPFIRPVHWLLVLLDGDVVPCSIFGVKSDRSSFGHRFHHPGRIEIASPLEYEEKLEDAFVIVDQERRRRIVGERLALEASAAGGFLKEDPDLEEEVANLVEWPVVVRGGFDRKYLDLPLQVTVTVMAKHQRYFSVVDGEGRLMPVFLAVANTDPSAGGGERGSRDPMIRGFERVLGARLEDAIFFFTEDCKKPLSDRIEHLRGILFQKGAGDYWLKCMRVEEIARVVASDFLRLEGRAVEKVARAARLCKADLATSMVYELPELQGIMGGIYAGRSGEDAEVARAIAEHYLPSSASDPLPSSDPGSIVSIADKIDSLVVFFSLGAKISATSDPLGMRRLCLGIIRVILSKGFRLDLRKISRLSFVKFEEQMREKDAGSAGKKLDDPTERLMEFFKERLKVFWRERASADILDAAMECGVEDLVKASRRLEALIEFQKSEEFEDLAVAFKRAWRITRDLVEGAGEIDTNLFERREESDLHEAVVAARPAIFEAYEREDYKGVFSIFRGLRSKIDDYFDNVFVNVEEAALRSSRLAMMRAIANLVAGAARLDLVHFERTKLEK